VYIAASLLCAFSPSIAVLIGLRFLQGLGGSAGIVIARAVVRDLYDGVAAARFFSRLMLVSGLAPILAPIVGGQLLRVTNWRGVFVVLALIGGVLLLGVVVGVPETWPPARRHGGGLADRLRGMGILVADRQLLGYALACGLAFAAMFAYISGSPFVVENIYGASPQLFSLAFAANAFGLAAAGQVNGRLVGSIAPRRLLTFGLGLTSGAGLTLLAVVLSGAPGLPTLLVPLFVLVASLGFVMPNATALALSGHPEAAGSASALVGSIQYVVGALVAPLVGIAGSYTAVPMAIVISALGVGAMTALLTMTGGRPSSG
jgi:DHA1 family bicyclomycin/chloramphenicol resistance-like MFS transporter